ncbi:MAG TPA: penicillin-binding transpeptidase domain-containing protein [Gaiellaceae bacterium]|nr:penicillin-binding transpeptidase domain-containing protein [Gaiellaceae bacterium]
MNTQLRHLAVVSAVLIAVLIGATTYWQSWAGGELANRQGNAVQLVTQLQIDRGTIFAANGTRLAWSVPHKKGGLTTYSRRYPTNGAFSQVVGYATTGQTQTGLEQSLNDFLTGSNTTLTNAFSQELDRLGGRTVHGDNVTLTLRPAAQMLAERLLAGRCGAVVALNPKTGAVYALASSPTYDPNLILQRNGYAKIAKIRGTCGDASALYDNATQGLYPPGSTFKMVTASAALDSGAYTPTSTFYDPGYCVEYGRHVSNASSPDGRAEAYGNVTLAQGLEHSINSVFCNVGKQIGAAKILKYAKRYGFYSSPPLDTPSDTIYPSGLYNKGKLFDPKDPATQVDPGTLAFGQERMLATPLQMALVAATIANHGNEPRPYLLQQVTAPDGSIVSTASPSTIAHPISAKTAAEINQMMQLVVQGGTAAGVGFPSSLDVAGKTGTAELNLGNLYDSWFACFAPATNPQVAIAVVVEKQPNGFGAAVAAPIAKAILENLLHR